MARHSRLVAAGLAGWLGFFAASCDDAQAPGPTGPTPPNPPPAAAAVVRLEIDAPPRIAPGESVQLTATIVRSDGSRESASDRVGWLVDAPALTVGRTGLAQGVAPGEVRVSVVFERFTATAVVLVLPGGTFKLSGTIADGGFGVGNVTVIAAPRSGATLTTKTTPDGQYAIYGVAGRVDVQLRKDGYFSRTETLDVGDHAALNVDLDPDTSTTSGTWTLTLTAGPCDAGATLPAEARQRVYTARIVEEWGPRAYMDARLSGADFVMMVDGSGGNHFTGFRDHDRDTLRINLYRHEPYEEDEAPSYYGLFERLRADLGLAITGQLDTTRTQSAIEGRFSGSFVLIRNPPDGPVEARCDSSAHDFDMRRQR